jgi:hypothetical protein
MEKNKGNQRLGPWAIFPDQPTSPTPAAHINHACSSLCDCLTGPALPVTAARAWDLGVPFRQHVGPQVSPTPPSPRAANHRHVGPAAQKLHLPPLNKLARISGYCDRARQHWNPTEILAGGWHHPSARTLPLVYKILLAISLGPRCPSPHRRGN